MNKQYVLHPGVVVNETSGQCYFISASALAEMHGVDLRDCVIFDPDPRRRGTQYAGYTHLYPEGNATQGTPKPVMRKDGPIGPDKRRFEQII